MLHSMRWSNIGSIYFGSVWPCMAWIVFTLLCLSRHIRPANDVFCTRRSNLLQRRLSKVSFRVPKTLQQLSSENSIQLTLFAPISYDLSSTQIHTMCKMSAKNHINRLDSTSEAFCFSFGMFFVRLLWPSAVDGRRICPYSGSNFVSRTLFRNGWRRNDVKRCGQLFRRWRFKEKN